MSAASLTCPARCAFIPALLLIWAGCATAPTGSVPAEISAPGVQFPSFTRVLGTAAVYISPAGERVEVVHDATSDIAIVKLPDGEAVVLPAEIAGSEGRYRDNRMTLWEHEGGALLWVDGVLVFSGSGR